MQRFLPGLGLLLAVGCGDDSPSDTTLSTTNSASGQPSTTPTAEPEDTGRTPTEGAGTATEDASAGASSATAMNTSGVTSTQGGPVITDPDGGDASETGNEPTETGEPITPTDQGDAVLFEGGGYRLLVSENGGRVLEYSLNGSNILSLEGTFTQHGSTLWVAPQTWGWPPSFDVDPYSYTIEGSDVTFTSTLSSEIQVSIAKRFNMSTTGVVSIEYALTSGDAPVSWAPWEVTRLAPTLCFFGTGAEGGSFDYSNPGGGVFDPIPTIADGPVTWVPWNTANVDQRPLLADASGWSGCATEDRLLFLKSFPDISASEFAQGSGEVKIWWEGNLFIELEQMGPYATLPANTTSTWGVQWSLQQIPADVEVEPQSESLQALLPTGA